MGSVCLFLTSRVCTAPVEEGPLLQRSTSRILYKEPGSDPLSRHPAHLTTHRGSILTTFSSLTAVWPLQAPRQAGLAGCFYCCCFFKRSTDHLHHNRWSADKTAKSWASLGPEALESLRVGLRELLSTGLNPRRPDNRIKAPQEKQS